MGFALVDTALAEELISPAPHKYGEDERQLLAALAHGKSDTAIAAELILSPKNVRAAIANLQTRLKARNRLHLISMALRDGVI